MTQSPAIPPPPQPPPPPPPPPDEERFVGATNGRRGANRRSWRSERRRCPGSRPASPSASGRRQRPAKKTGRERRWEDAVKRRAHRELEGVHGLILEVLEALLLGLPRSTAVASAGEAASGLGLACDEYLVDQGFDVEGPGRHLGCNEWPVAILDNHAWPGCTDNGLRAVPEKVKPGCRTSSDAGATERKTRPGAASRFS